ncbi:addiction module toxin, RelE/StbE family [Tardiphaga sp. OK246]|jgi:toxin ParE1/3/4|uniref:type II toxin-antitoxin system RelE/ParE family toxin n=1 Tax=Tardiphaga sp. OK246 TaxID=1855307 RepID=UPI000B6B85B2|nr:type II toxin-antitoxin system RelE/ParE family toxin [Tardiphaga sp. OK246]SNS91307.1 addiction module toxin, RelE/StbE family [Tardiphaga sp. OK246]
MKIVFDAKAISDLENIRQWIARENPLMATKVLERLFSGVRSLALFPARGRNGLEPGTRELVVPGLPYIVVYKIYDDVNELVVAAVFHTSQGRSEAQD